MPKIDEEEIKRVYIQADLLYSEAEVEQAINKLAALVTEDMADKTPVVFPVLNGGLVVGGKLLTKLNFPKLTLKDERYSSLMTYLMRV